MADSINFDNHPDDMMSDQFPDMDDVEEIVLGNEFDETASIIIPRETNHEYRQENKFRGEKLYFKIYNDVYMHQTAESLRNKKATPVRFNLTFFDPEPTRKSHFAWNWFFVLLVSFFLGSILVYIGGFSGLEIAHPSMWIIGLALLIVGIYSTMIFLYRTQDKFVYRSLIGQVPLLELFNKPRQDEYHVFIEKLKSHIDHAQHRQGLTMVQRLKGELTDLRRLSEEGVISVEAYEDARGLILRHKEFQ